MMRCVFAVLILCLVAGPAVARLGETEKQCDARYGAAISENRSERKLTKTYQMDEFVIRVVMMSERYLIFRKRYRAIALNVTRRIGLESRNLPIELADIEEVLTANSGGSRWNEVNPTFEAARRSSIEDQSKILADAEIRTRWKRDDGATALYDMRRYEMILRMPWSSGDTTDSVSRGF